MTFRRATCVPSWWRRVLRVVGQGAWAWMIGLSFGGLCGFFVGMFITWLKHR